ncbi:uncharacterized protein LOC135687392 [Rhopilema esculentum]|uniref:uncharacterized protein LOC135687392 n=1 Tax=Rhopilema esculentum TaxID=499914 RepID=UPI0031D97FDA
MDFLDHFRCTGFALFPGSKKEEQFLLENKDVGQKCSSFIILPHTPDYSQDDIRRLLNEKYSKFTGTLKQVEYEKFNSSFVMKDWPENVPFMQPGRFSQKRIKTVMEAMSGIEFESFQENIEIIQEADDSSTEVKGTDEAFLPDPNDDIEASTVIHVQYI